MATKVKSAPRNRQARPVEAPVLGSVQLPPAAREALLHSDPAPLHEVPKNSGAETALARVESLLGKGHLGAALREARALKLGDAPLAGRYEFVRQEKMSRAQIGIAERYFLRGDMRNARRFYERALKPDTGNPEVVKVAEVAGKAFDDLVRRRSELIRGLRRDIEKKDFAQWCGRKKALNDVTILDVRGVRERIFPDFRLETVFAGRPRSIPILAISTRCRPRPKPLHSRPPFREQFSALRPTPPSISMHRRPPRFRRRRQTRSAHHWRCPWSPIS
jgi:hypothetical protein